jgi:hypothetical protein
MLKIPGLTLRGWYITYLEHSTIDGDRGEGDAGDRYILKVTERICNYLAIEKLHTDPVPDGSALSVKVLSIKGCHQATERATGWRDSIYITDSLMQC